MKQMQTFQQNEWVEWNSQASGSTTLKVGQVIRIIPAGKTPGDVLADQPLDRKVYGFRNFGGGMNRKHESYLIAVKGQTPYAKIQLYWPRVPQLRKSSPERAVI